MCCLVGWYSELDLRRWIPGLTVALGEVHGRVGKQWKIQHIEPDHRLAAIISMIVPVPGGGYDNIAPGKRHLLALYSSKPITVNDETASKGDMTMSRGNLAGIDNLETSIDSVRGKGCLYKIVLEPTTSGHSVEVTRTHGRVDQHQYPSLSLLLGYKTGGRLKV